MSSGFTSHQGGCESAYLVTTTLAPLPLPQGPQTAHVSGRYVATYRSPTHHQWHRTQGRRPQCALFLLSTTFFSAFSPSQHKPCHRSATALPPRPPNFNRSSMTPWMCMRRKQKTSFSHIPLPPSYSPATRPLPFYLSLKTSSSNLIAVAGAMRG
jgi:hypothetical protein